MGVVVASVSCALGPDAATGADAAGGADAGGLAEAAGVPFESEPPHEASVRIALTTDAVSLMREITFVLCIGETPRRVSAH